MGFSIYHTKLSFLCFVDCVIQSSDWRMDGIRCTFACLCENDNLWSWNSHIRAKYVPKDERSWHYLVLLRLWESDFVKLLKSSFTRTFVRPFSDEPVVQTSFMASSDSDKINCPKLGSFPPFDIHLCSLGSNYCISFFSSQGDFKWSELCSQLLMQTFKYYN